jgi:hypothetical protein
VHDHAVVLIKDAPPRREAQQLLVDVEQRVWLLLLIAQLTELPLAGQKALQLGRARLGKSQRGD